MALFIIILPVFGVHLTKVECTIKKKTTYRKLYFSAHGTGNVFIFCQFIIKYGIEERKMAREIESDGRI